MNEAWFWAEVAKIGWCAEVVERADRVKAGLMRKLGEGGAAAFRAHFEAASTRLSSLLAKPLRERGAWLGESFGDCVDHIIGLGEEEYRATLLNPERGVERFLKHDFLESFAYVVPWPSEFAALQAGHYQARAAELLAEYRSALEAKRGDAVQVEVVVDALNVLVVGDVPAFLAKAEAAEGAARGVAEGIRRQVEHLIGPNGTVIFHGADVSNPHGVINLVHDARVYLG